MDIFIGDCVRSVRGKARPDGGLAEQTPYGLVGALIDAVEQRGAIERSDVDRLTLGCVGQVGAQGGHIALTTKIASRLPETSSAHTINNFCASGLTAIGQAVAAVSAGQSELALAGGVEMLSQVPFMADRADYYSDQSFEPADRYIPVALAADLLAMEQDVTREEMDSLSYLSQSRAANAENDAALLASRITIGNLDHDEAVRVTSPEKLAAMPPAFGGLAEQYAHALSGQTLDPRMSVANAPPMTDGAGLAAIGGAKSFLSPRARVVAFAETGADARQSLTAGFAAMDKVLAQAGLSLDQIDRIEFMEAFAVPYALFRRNYQPDMDRVNVSGGHIAKGHPMGATGAILLSTLLDALDAADGKYGLVVASGAQGVGAAIIVERLS
ncbi:acetyl-CoA C-acyltransferase [Parasphingorhabdus flavimaris]|uniref:Acetyl-CoA C-acyltransferase n=1 Tax=Parasphingorhabdus flavimaris TaxID=266812 RepID=A0ABX2N3A1_9SPHN|nr:acetyl-CoA C-acyltransferase [Parasphingorhabdus flavimaris]NVD28149.1 acetyl-CoA C-acyltransferase [Parasphingorhabdus flavimaris]|tara:strand:- start:7662 stop:8816 length:1155 start_codon:yes stop_codon:yes gene_type:complete